MSETKPKYEIGRALCEPWLCSGCKRKLGMIVAGAIKIKGKVVMLKRESADVQCPECGAVTKWPFGVKP